MIASNITMRKQKGTSRVFDMSIQRPCSVHHGKKLLYDACQVIVHTLIELQNLIYSLSYALPMSKRSELVVKIWQFISKID